jgi:hypothetical protein
LANFQGTGSLIAVVPEVTVVVGVLVVHIMVAEAMETPGREAMETPGRVAMETPGQVALEIRILTGAMGEIDYSRNVLATILAGVVVFYHMHDASLTIQQINGTLPPCHLGVLCPDKACSIWSLTWHTRVL